MRGGDALAAASGQGDGAVASGTAWSLAWLQIRMLITARMCVAAGDPLPAATPSVPNYQPQAPASPICAVPPTPLAYLPEGRSSPTRSDSSPRLVAMRLRVATTLSMARIR